MLDCTGCRYTPVLFMLTELLWDHKFMSDVTGCQKIQVSVCTGSTVQIWLGQELFCLESQCLHILNELGHDKASCIRMRSLT